MCSNEEFDILTESLLTLSAGAVLEDVEGKIINQDFFAAVPFLPRKFADLLILDPPYNLSKDYNGHLFNKMAKDEYQRWFRSVIEALLPALAPRAIVYVCSDWKTSGIIQPILDDAFIVRNRITWERDKGRGAKANWKNNSEDIWFCTHGNEYTFNVDAVKLKRKVIAPYRDTNGLPKDWEEGADGNYRLTHPSNIWTDITVPFWSMPENTDHPTQKPEKLIAKLILASSNVNDIVFDPFIGSGTSAVVAAKLGRRFVGIEVNRDYCCWALKRLRDAKTNPSIQGYSNGVFWERNTLNERPTSETIVRSQQELPL